MKMKSQSKLKVEKIWRQMRFEWICQSNVKFAKLEDFGSPFASCNCWFQLLLTPIYKFVVPWQSKIPPPHDTNALVNLKTQRNCFGLVSNKFKGELSEQYLKPFL